MSAGNEQRKSTSPSRRRAARLLREFGDAFLTYDFDDAALDRMSATIHIPMAYLMEAPLRADPIVDGHSDQCFITGDASPIGPAAKVCIEGAEVVLRARLTRTFEGSPGFVHLAAVAAIFQDLFGVFVDRVHGGPCVPARTEIEYVRPVPLGRDIEFRARARLEDADGLELDATATLGAEIVARAVGRMQAI